MFKLITGIKAKILFVMLLLTVISFGLTAILTLSNIRHLGNYTLDACDNLSGDVLLNTKKVFTERTSEELLSLVVGQAMIANVQLDRLEDEIAMIANMAGKYLLGEKNPIINGNEARFLSFEKPSSPFARARIVVFNQQRGKEYERKLNLLGRTYPLMKFIYRNQRNLDMMFLCTVDGYYVAYPWMKMKAGFSPFVRKWYKDALAADGRVVWVGPYISAADNKIVLTCAKALKDFNGKIFAVFGQDLTVLTLTKEFISSRLVAHGRALLIDKKGNVLARRDMNSKGMQWYEDLEKENLFAYRSPGFRKVAAKMTAGEEGIEKIVQDGNELYVAYAPIPITGWSICVSAREEVITESARRVEAAMTKNIRLHRESIRDYFGKNVKVYLITGGIVLVLVLTLGLFFSRRITAPVLMLKSKALKIMNGDFNSDIHLNTGDELEHLDKSFDMMTHEITRYMRNAAKIFRERERIEQEFAVAGNIQSLMLPAKFKETSELKVDSLMKPTHDVSGDFYNYFMVDEKHLFFCLGRVAGKGLPAAMLMAQFMTLLSHLGATKIAPDRLLLMVNNTLVINNKTDMSVSAFCGFLNILNGDLVFANAEHVPALYIRPGKISGMATEKTPSLGITPLKDGAFQCRHLRLQPGDILLFTTNGIASEINEKGEVFGEKYLANSFAAFRNADSGVLEFAMRQLEKFYGAQSGKTDIFLLSIKYKGHQA
ncbi:MAG: SpoIIE family protein phosphatase [Victivallales bacterium]|nr:SpoIIE family protein phosphatase [Victivallales bacterium]